MKVFLYFWQWFWSEDCFSTKTQLTEISYWLLMDLSLEQWSLLIIFFCHHGHFDACYTNLKKKIKSSWCNQPQSTTFFWLLPCLLMLAYLVRLWSHHFSLPRLFLQVFLPNGDVVYAQVERRGSTSGFINVWAVASGSAFNNTEGEGRTAAWM